jgi:hypothetical protein
MATRFYLSASGETVPISPSPDAAWENVSIFSRVLTDVTKRSLAMTSVSLDDNTEDNKDIIFRQYISWPLTAGQTITGSQAIKAQCRCSADTAFNLQHMYLTIGSRIIAADGSTVQKTVLPVTRDNTEIGVSLVNRQFTATSATTNYTTIAGDRLVIEIGTGGDPNTGLDHDTTLSLGDNHEFDLPEDDSTVTTRNPWVELTDSLTFVYVIGINKSINLFTRGHVSINDNLNLFIHGQDTKVQNVNLFINGFEINSDNIELYINGKDNKNQNLDLFINGHIAETGSLNLFINGLDTNNDNINLTITGHEPVDNNLDLFIAGIGLITDSIDLFMDGDIFPSESDVRYGITYNYGSQTGVLVIPEERDVRFGVEYGVL